MTNAIDQQMREALVTGIFPGAVLLAAREGNIRFFEAYGYADLFTGRAMKRETVFDLASLTKPLATALAIMKLVQDSRISLELPLREVLPGFGESGNGDVTVSQLLLHTSGLPDYRPFFRELDGPTAGHRKVQLRERLKLTETITPSGSQVRYSDLGFMLLEWVVEVTAAASLDTYVRTRLYEPLGVADGLFFLENGAGGAPDRFAATEVCPWRNRLMVGEVHDENAWAVGGVCGHAGLFGSASAVHALLETLLDYFHRRSREAVLDPSAVRRFLKHHPRYRRSLGFDVPDEQESSSGRFFGAQSVGHLGFCGTSFWVDPARDLIVILLTNRVHPFRENDKIREFRPRIHDCILNELGCV